MPNSDRIKRRWTYANWYRLTFASVGAAEIFFSVPTLVQGPKQLMSQFGIPEVVVNSPHYLDAMFWVLLHMFFIGLTNLSVAWLVRDRAAQRWLPRMFVCFHAVYAYLDIRASDSPLGTGLYQGSASLLTPIISCTLFLLMLHLAVRSFVNDVDDLA